jgi:glycosyltransferase involved in cell wall biosynthesis
MRICYLLLSSTFGMHQYTADLANRMAEAGHEVHLVTTRYYPADRYAPGIQAHTPCSTRSAGLSGDLLRLKELQATLRVVCAIQPQVVHITGPHLWNLSLVRSVTGQRIPVVHSIHDLDPHSGSYYGSTLRLWNWSIIRAASHILVHGQKYLERLIDQGVAPHRLTYTPLLHLFLSNARLTSLANSAIEIEHQPWALFFGRLQVYKGVTTLFAACDMMRDTGQKDVKVVVAGPGDISSLWAGPTPHRVELRNRLIADEEAIDLFRRCGLLVLPYLDATQSALVAAAYYFGKPVIVTQTGVLPEYVQDGVTGVIIDPDHPASLARCLEDMLGNPARLGIMGAAGRTWYLEQRVAETDTLHAMYHRLVS